MKRKDVVARIAAEAKRRGIDWSLVRHRGPHDVYRLGATMIPVPRHREIGPKMTETIFKETETELGRRWWK